MRRLGGCGALLAASLGLGACTVGPDYIRPAATTPPAFKEAPRGWKIAQPMDGRERGPWWRVYRDPTIDRLVPQVAISNENLKAYEAAYRQAQAVVREARANLFPTVSTSPGVSRARSSGAIASSGTAEVSASWELDIWGKIRRQIESNQAAAQASAAQLADLTLTAQAELITDYFELRYQDALTTLLNDTVRAYERTLRITENQYAAGTSARSDVITAQTQLATTRASAIAAGQSRAVYEHAIALLVGRAPIELTIPRGGLARSVPEVPGTLPSWLLERRPDIAEAERTVQQQSALVGVAVAALYPTITLSAAGGYAGTIPLLTAANAAWSVAAAGTQVLFDGGNRLAAVDAANAATDQAVATYRQTVLSAFRDVEDQLSNLRIYRQQAGAQAEAVRLSRQAVEIAIREYQAGTQAYTTVVTAQATLLTNEETALQIQQNRLVASATLIKALGGGWTTARLPPLDAF